jgi:hypothetical protein
MITDATNDYSVFLADMAGDRLDFVFHHPNLEPVRQFRRSANTPLGEVITFPQYGLCESGLATGAVGFLNVQHITRNGEIIFEPPAFVAECNDNDRLHEGDILIARTGHTLGKTALITREFAGFAFGSFCIRFTLLRDVQYSNDFVVRFLNSDLGQQQILMLKTGSGKYNINSDQIRDIRLPSIGLPRQDEAVDSVRPVEAEALRFQDNAIQERRAADTLLLQQLRIEVPAAERKNYFFKTGREDQTLWFSVFLNEINDRLHYLFLHPRLRGMRSLTDRYQTTTLAEICREPILIVDPEVKTIFRRQ